MRVVGQLSFFLVVFALSCTPVKKENITTRIDSLWHAPDTASIPNDLTRYGRKLIANTSFYLGPKGMVDSISNGMNCQNCHLDAGTRPYGNNFGSVASLYPKFRARSGGAESVEKRVNDCIQRSLNGKPLDSLSKEMRALVAYITWVGHEVPKGTKAKGSGLIEIKFLNRSADTLRGKKLYETQCRVCHQKNGQGMIASNEKGYVYPPLWGAGARAPRGTGLAGSHPPTCWGDPPSCPGFIVINYLNYHSGRCGIKWHYCPTIRK